MKVIATIRIYIGIVSPKPDELKGLWRLGFYGLWSGGSAFTIPGLVYIGLTLNPKLQFGVSDSQLWTSGVGGLQFRVSGFRVWGSGRGVFLKP